jgi:hypothetical protein
MHHSRLAVYPSIHLHICTYIVGTGGAVSPPGHLLWVFLTEGKAEERGRKDFGWPRAWPESRSAVCIMYILYLYSNELAFVD